MSNSFQLPIVVEEGDLTPPPTPEPQEPAVNEPAAPFPAPCHAAAPTPAPAVAQDEANEDHLARRATRPLPVPTPPSRPPTRARDPPPSGVRPMARLVSIHPFFIKKK